MMVIPRLSARHLFLTLTVALHGVATAQLIDRQGQQPDNAALGKAPNPYHLAPFHDDFPVELTYPPRLGREYQKTRRKMLRTIASNLQGNTRRETWKFATEFYWRAPEDAVDPLIEAMDRAMVNPGLADVVRNCCEAMGKMANEEFDAALQRALHHKKEATRQAAYSALAASGTVETLRKLRGDFALMDGRARTAWLRAVRRRLPLDEATGILKELTMSRLPPAVLGELLKETRKLPAKNAAEVLAGKWDDAIEEFKAIIAGVRHAAGDASGTVWLRDAMQGDNVLLARLAVRHCAFGPEPSKSIGDLREFLLQATTHAVEEIRAAALTRLLAIEGDDVTDAIEVLTAPEQPWGIRGVALRALTNRGRNEAVSAMLDELPTATGSRLRGIVNQLSASGDARGVPVIVSRFEKAGPTDGRPFLQALAQNGTVEAAEALWKIYVGPEKVVAKLQDKDLTTRTYLPTLFLNLRGSEDVILRNFHALDSSQWRLRARLLTTLTGMAADRIKQPELQQRCVAPVRKILHDQQELPQMRVLALNAMTSKWLSIDDALRLKNGRTKESVQMRALLSDFLSTYF